MPVVQSDLLFPSCFFCIDQPERKGFVLKKFLKPHVLPIQLDIPPQSIATGPYSKDLESLGPGFFSTSYLDSQSEAATERRSSLDSAPGRTASTMKKPIPDFEKVSLSASRTEKGCQMSEKGTHQLSTSVMPSSGDDESKHLAEKAMRKQQVILLIQFINFILYVEFNKD